MSDWLNGKVIVTTLGVFLLVAGISADLQAAKMVEVKVLDKDYLIVHFKDGDVQFVDEGTSDAAYRGHRSDPENSYVMTHGEPLNLSKVAEVGFWVIKSEDDAFYGTDGVSPVAVHRKTRVNGMSYTGYDSSISDHGFDYTIEHFIYIELPSSMQQGRTYSLKIDESLGSDVTSTSITFDIFNNVSEAVHVNLVGYLSSSRVKAADLYHFIGDGGSRDYSEFEGNEVFIYNVDSEELHSVGRVTFWMENQTEERWNLTGSDVWTVDFTGFSKPGTYRLVVEGVGCSQDFEIRGDIYRVPYKTSILGYYYMRIGEDRMDLVPVPRRPLWIQDVDPPDTKIIVTDMHPYHPEWSTFSRGDVWDRPEDWEPYVMEGSPTNPNAIGGHSDALDWDRHLGHVVNVYDLLLAYILSDGALDDDDLRIGESGNGIPDILDEARNEVDFWLNLRYQGGFSHGVTNPDSNNRLYQAGNTGIAAWANTLNSAMMSYSFQIAGREDLASAYKDSAIIAYNFADASPDPMLDETVQGIKGIDFKMMAAAYLYNITGDTHYEDIFKNECVISTPTSIIHEQGSHNQLWGVAAYLLTKQPVHHPDLYENMKSAIIAEAKSHEADFVSKRPSRRGYAPEQAHWQTNQDMHRTILAHAVTDSDTEKVDFLDALLLEADWGLGRNPLNKIQMTTATTELADKRSFENIYTSGRDDGTPGLHPGHTPYLNTLSWGGHMMGSNPGQVFDRFYYPEIDSWPHAEKYINTRFIWSHSEFTPRQTMRGKALLYAYLYGLYKSGTHSIADAQPKIIYDTDFGGDADDLGALSMLHGFHQSGEAELLAVMIWNREEYSVAGVDAANRFYGHPNIPIGVREGASHSLDWDFSRAIAKELPHERTNREAPGAVDLYREILSGQDDNSVIIVTVGPLANIQNLLQSGPDHHSVLTGKELFHQKVEKMVVMGGEYPEGRQEWNFWGGMEGVTQYVFDHVDVPVVFLGYEIGVRIHTGRIFNKLPEDHPLYLGFYHFSKYAPWMEERFTGEILNNATYDQTAVLYAVRGGIGEYWEKVEGGYNEIDTDGRNRWVDGEVTNQSYMRLLVEPDVLARKIEELMLFEKDFNTLQ